MKKLCVFVSWDDIIYWRLSGIAPYRLPHSLFFAVSTMRNRFTTLLQFTRIYGDFSDEGFTLILINYWHINITSFANNPTLLLWPKTLPNSFLPNRFLLNTLLCEIGLQNLLGIIFIHSMIANKLKFSKNLMLLL